MEKFWKAALGVAGIGTVGLFVLWGLYKQWLTLPVFPQLTQEQAFQLFRYFLFSTFGATVLSITAYAYIHRPPNGYANHDLPRYSPTLRLPNGSRFTEGQFDAYRDTWCALQRVRDAGQALWQLADHANLRQFSDILDDTRHKVDEAGIYFRDEDYEELQSLLYHFKTFRDGKGELIQYIQSHPEVWESGGSPGDKFVIDMIVQSNREHHERYSRLLRRLRSTYHNSLAWQANAA